MIESVFISDSKNTLLYGDLPMELSEEIGVQKELDQNIFTAQESKDNLDSPITYLKDSRLARLRVNDVYLNIIFKDIDNFQASKLLLDLKNKIKECLSKISSDTIRNNYFSIVKLLHHPFLIKSVVQNAEIKHHRRVFIDVVEEVNCLIENRIIIYNNSYGTIFADQKLKNKVEIVFEKNNSLSFKSPFDLELSNSMIKTNCILDYNTNILNYYKRDSPLIYLTAKRSKDLLTIESTCKDNFKFIEIDIPMGQQAFKVETVASAGTAEFDIKTGILKWKLQDVVCSKETIKFKASSLEEETLVDLIEIRFKIENPTDSNIKLISCTSEESNNQSFWSRTTIQNGKYFIK